MNCMLKTCGQLLFCLILLSCNNNSSHPTEKRLKSKTAVLLVNHGSRSAKWREALVQLEQSVKDSLLRTGKIEAVRTAFMEYTEPSIATQLREFDREGYTDVILIPVLLTVSSHSFDDIPTLIGQKEDPKSMELFKIEKMERYRPDATVHIAPLLNFSGLLKENILRRFKALSSNPATEGLTLIAYGDKTYQREWSQLMNESADYVKRKTGLRSFSYGWCGHVANYSSDSTTNAIREVLKSSETAVVIPVLVAFDEMFQVKIIGDGINRIEGYEHRVKYAPDAILPDSQVIRWVWQSVDEQQKKITH